MPGTDPRSRAGAGIVSPDVNLRAIVFDFDGTLVESIDTKTEAFRVLFADHPEHVDRIVALHLEQGGRSRYEKFAMIYRDVLHRDPQPGEFDRLGKRFEALVFDAVVKCPFVPGAEMFLDQFGSRWPMVLVSGTPHEELLRILDRRKLRARFAEVHGSPPEKGEIVRDVLTRCGWAAGQVLFVGDAMSDLRAAISFGLKFIGRVPRGEISPFPPGTRTIVDLSELPAAVMS